MVLLGLLVASAAWADATGKWTWTVNGSKWTLELKQDGEKLTGTIADPYQMGRKVNITEGKANGNDISFAMVRNTQGQESRVTFKGTVDGDTLKLKVTYNFQGQEQTREVTAKREK